MGQQEGGSVFTKGGLAGSERGYVLVTGIFLCKMEERQHLQEEVK